MFNKVMDLIKTKDLNVPGLLFYNYSKLNLDYEQLYFLIYLLNLDNLEFDISKFSKELNKKPKEIIKIINDLDEKEPPEIENPTEFFLSPFKENDEGYFTGMSYSADTYTYERASRLFLEYYDKNGYN